MHIKVLNLLSLKPQCTCYQELNLDMRGSPLWIYFTQEIPPKSKWLFGSQCQISSHSIQEIRWGTFEKSNKSTVTTDFPEKQWIEYMPVMTDLIKGLESGILLCFWHDKLFNQFKTYIFNVW